MLPLSLIIFNTLALLIIIIVAVLMARWGYFFSQNIGDSPVTDKYKWRILKSLLILMFVSLLAATINALVAS